MPFPFIPSTTSHLTFQTHFISATHPSLPAAATSQRNVLRSALKSHKRLSVVDQGNNLPYLVSCLATYLKYLNTINEALSGRPISTEDVDVALVREVEVEWRPTLLSPTVPGKTTDRVKGRGLDYEIYFVHHTLAVMHVLLARQSLLSLYATVNPSPDERKVIIQNANKSLRTAYSLHTYLTQTSVFAPDEPPSFPPNAVDVTSSTQSSLQRLASAEISLLAVLKDDPYPGLLVQSRNDSDRDWMIRAPQIPNVRAQVLTRLCIGAAEHAAAAHASLKAEGRKVTKDLLDYTEDLKRTARARAYRFQALDSNSTGESGKALAWLHAAFNELGIEINVKEGSSRTSRLDRFRSNWNERKEDKRIAKADPRWGMDGGKAEETRILEYLEKKYSKENNTINIQVIPEWRPLVASLPSGMNLTVEDKWKVTVLEEDDLSHMRSPLEEKELSGNSSGEDDGIDVGRPNIIGAFPDEQAKAGPSYY